MHESFEFTTLISKLAWGMQNFEQYIHTMHPRSPYYEKQTDFNDLADSYPSLRPLFLTLRKLLTIKCQQVTNQLQRPRGAEVENFFKAFLLISDSSLKLY